MRTLQRRTEQHEQPSPIDQYLKSTRSDGGSEPAGGERTSAPESAQGAQAPVQELDPATAEKIRQEGYQKGVADERARREKAIDEALQEVLRQTQEISANLHQVRAQAEADAERLVRAVLRGVLPAIAERATGLELQTAINDVLNSVQPSSTVAVTLHPAVARAIEDRIGVTNMPDGVRVDHDPKLTVREAYVTWDDGGAEIDFGAPLERCLAVLDDVPVVDRSAGAESAGSNAQSQKTAKNRSAQSGAKRQKSEKAEAKTENG